MRVLLLGSGGREHALARALARDGSLTELHAARGNPGIADLAELHDTDPADPVAITALARRTAANLVVVGPEAPLMAGVSDALRAAGMRCFGPGRSAAMIEGSKSFAKEIMISAGIPTAMARTCRTEAEVDLALDKFGPPFVVKADGLAAGKGVLVTNDRAAAQAHARAFGPVVIEEYLDGPEVSVFALADGANAVPLLPAQDYKRAYDGDTGPNTGGMGAYVPLPWAPPDLAAETLQTVIEPALAELAARGTPYRGLLYAGLALTTKGLKVVEFNARFGDPETQVVLDRLATPLAGLLAAAADGDLIGLGPDGAGQHGIDPHGAGQHGARQPQWAAGSAVTVVLAAEGYPGTPTTGDVIEGIEDSERIRGAYILHAGTVRRGADLESAGGRVLDIVGTGQDVAAARSTAYAAAARIRMRGGWYRQDIALLPGPGMPAAR